MSATSNVCKLAIEIHSGGLSDLPQTFQSRYIGDRKPTTQYQSTHSRSSLIVSVVPNGIPIKGLRHSIRASTATDAEKVCR